MRYQQGTAVVARRIGAETVLVPVRQNVGDLESIYTINPIGADLWDRMAEPQTPDSLVHFLVAEYEVVPAQATSDVQIFLSELAELQLVEVRDDS